MKPADQSLQTFNTLIAQLEGGALNEELTEKLRQCISEISEACADRGGTHKASLTLTLNFEMNHKDRFVELSAAISEKLPKAPRGRAGIFFTDEFGNLTRENPRQYSLDDELARQRQRNAETA